MKTVPSSLHDTQEQVCLHVSTHICDEISYPDPQQPKPSRLTTASQLNHSLPVLSTINSLGMAAQPLI